MERDWQVVVATTLSCLRNKNLTAIAGTIDGSERKEHHTQ